MSSGPSPYEREFVSRSVDLGYLSGRDVLALYRQEAETSTLMPLDEWLASTGRMTREEVARVRETLVEGAVEIPAPASPVGSTLGGYRIVQEIGSGGMGKLYRAYDPALEKFFALKVLPGDYAADPNLLERFRTEAKLASRIDDPHVVPILRFGEERGLHYCVMPLVEGTNLRGHVERNGGPLPLDEALAILFQAAQGLAAIHRVGIVHRDVKPENILLDREDRVRVVDFGLARDVEVDSSLTAPGQVLGTPYYMSPEQAVGQPVDVRSDIYSLGLTFYFLLAAEPPFQGSSPFVVLSKQATEPVPDPALRNPTARGPATLLLREMTAKEPEDRPQTMEDVVARIDSLREDAASVRPPERGRALARGGRRSPARVIAFAAAGLGVLLLVGVVLWAAGFFGKEKDEAPPAGEPLAGPIRPDDAPPGGSGTGENGPPAGGNSTGDADRWLADADEFRSASASDPGFLERALAKYREVIRRHPDTLAASRSADRIAEILQGEARALEDRLAALADSGEAKEAFAEIEEARTRFPDDVWPGMLASVTEFLRKRLASALDLLLSGIDLSIESGGVENLMEARGRLRALEAPGRLEDPDPERREALREPVRQRIAKVARLVEAALAGELGPVFSALSLGDIEKAREILRETLARFEEDAEKAVLELDLLAESLGLARRSMWRGLLSGDFAAARAGWEDRKKVLALQGVLYPVVLETAPLAAFEAGMSKAAARLDEDRRTGRWIRLGIDGDAKPERRLIVEVRRADDLLSWSIVFRDFQESGDVEKGFLEISPGDLVLLSLGRALDAEAPEPPAQGQESYDSAVLYLCLGDADAAEALARAGVPGEEDRARILFWANLVREEAERLGAEEVGPSPGESPEEREPEPARRLSERVREHFGHGARVLEAKGGGVRIEAVYEFASAADLDYFAEKEFGTCRAEVRDGSWWIEKAPPPSDQEGGSGHITLRGEWAEEIEVEVVFGITRAGNYCLSIQYFQEYRSDDDSRSFDAMLYGDHAEIRDGPFVELLGADSRRPEPEELGSGPLGKELRADVQYVFVAGARGTSHQVSFSSHGTRELRIQGRSDGARVGLVAVSWGRISGIRFDRIRVRGLLAPSTVQELSR
ncbi:MAG: serine/threonine protein kinase [Planctomycetes bacterium]|nr:serine/threonine protein kinase [Planctomycetota bacterium]